MFFPERRKGKSVALVLDGSKEVGSGAPGSEALKEGAQHSAQAMDSRMCENAFITLKNVTPPAAP